MSKNVLISAIALMVLIIFLGGGIWWYSIRSAPAEEIANQPIEIPEWYYTDQDGDGISNTDEEVYGTSLTESDTDGDTVLDKLEIEVYKTDPTNPDTDGDGFSDGLEIIQGYDPLVK